MYNHEKNVSCPVITKMALWHISCAQMHELPGSHSGGNQESTFF